MDIKEKLLDCRNIHLAYERVKNGVMNKELYSYTEQKCFEECIPKIYHKIQQDLKKPKDYLFQPLEILHKPKSFNEDLQTWEKRPVARIDFYDAVIAQTVMNIIAEQIGYLLPKENFGYKLQREHSAFMYEHWKYGYSDFLKYELRALEESSAYTHVVEIDIKDFYTKIDLDILKEELYKNITDKKSKNVELVKEWINKIITMKRIDVKGEELSIDGLPQGPLFSPLLALFYIRDCFVHLRKKSLLSRTLYFGYIDDFRFYCDNEEQAKKILDEFKEYLSLINLRENPEKSRVLELSEEKKREYRIIGKGSNLDRAIIDDVLIGVDSKKKMRDNLMELLNETKALLQGDFVSTKFAERISKFVWYRYIKLIDGVGEWDKFVNELGSRAHIKGNFSALLHVLHKGAVSSVDKRKLIDTLKRIIMNQEYNGLSYIRFVILQYLFKWSPKEIRLNSAEKMELVKILEYSCTPVFLKAALSRCHPEWYETIKTINRINFSNLDRETETVLAFALNQGVLPEIYKRNTSSSMLAQSESKLSYEQSYAYYLKNDFMDSESFKGIMYNRMKNKVKRQKRGKLSLDADLASNIICFGDYASKLSLEKKQNLIISIFKWLQVQLKYEVHVPCSVLHPDYIWLDKDIKEIYLFGNPFFQNEIL